MNNEQKQPMLYVFASAIAHLLLRILMLKPKYELRWAAGSMSGGGAGSCSMTFGCGDKLNAITVVAIALKTTAMPMQPTMLTVGREECAGSIMYVCLFVACVCFFFLAHTISTF